MKSRHRHASMAAAVLCMAGCLQQEPPVQQTPLPCDVQRELAAHCWSCHGEDLRYTAPMKLVSVEDFRAPAPSDPTLLVSQSAQARIHDAQRPMPPRPFSPLGARELTALDTWLESGASSPGPRACGPAGAASDYASRNGEDVPSPDAHYECVELRAHGGDRASPFEVDGAKDLYQCFEFNAPMGNEEVYGVAFKPHIDNAALIHHWLLYQHNDEVVDGTTSPCQRTYPNSSLIAGWAPGTGAMTLPDDVGTQLPASGYTLEVHYNGSGRDRSGVEVCYTRQPRPHIAAMHWLGTTRILGTSATGFCQPTTTEPVHTLKYWPHMHLAGQHMQVMIQRANGDQEVWHDAPFDFEDQRLWDTDKVISPGDTITTTCSYSRPSIAGEGTRQEMCYYVVLAYPVGGLTQPGGTGFSINQCVN